MTITQATLRRALEAGNPVIHGSQATFIWEGKTAPRLAGDFNNWDSSSTPFKRLAPRLQPASSKTLWSCTLTLPRDAYIEYAFDDPASQERFLDPWNDKSVNNGVGGRNNYFYMPEAMASPFTLRRANIPGGALTSHHVETRWLRDEHEREIYLYRPPVSGPVPLLVVYDGQDYLHRAKLAVIVDNLVADGRMSPVALAFLPSAGRWRNVEYACSDATLLWLDQIVLPLAKEQLNLLDVKKHPGTYGVLGASLGATMALHTALRMPDVFGRVLCQSGAFMIESRDFAVVDLVRHRQAHHTDIWMDIGTLDYLLPDNRAMLKLLHEKKYNVTYREFSGGHNYTAWRDDVWHGLEALFPA